MHVTRAIRRKRRESMAIRRESRATRLVAAILTSSFDIKSNVQKSGRCQRKLPHPVCNYWSKANQIQKNIAFLICWIPYFCVSVYRGICAGLGTNTDKQLHIRLFAVTSWLGYAHSCFNPVIYTCLNKNFRRTVRKFFASSRWRRSRKL
ncbi:unnamed protein product [Dracunculus medinensis]|uniref:G_PROTEIN_RECEP_F1_2 domain-containing protein n=1 Tax=Dracunculus medinensis TaxID=318479 RepID=A0A0N4U152_DRAME|nr:unnamed protein product [Dracunculus medinensis]